MKDLEQQKYWIWFSQIKGLGSKRKQKLLKIYKTPENIYLLNKDELLRVNGIGEELANKILDVQIRKNLNKYIQHMIKNKIEIININDNEYPKQLKEIYDPPISLYIKGNKEILKYTTIAVIGCREATEYGKKASKYFAYNLAKRGVNIVSGLARGIDTYSHIGAICADGKTTAVIGNGIDSIYPKENAIIAEKILEKGGIIISEYPLGTKPEKMNFPARNRIISGLSKAIIVVEAKEKSGTLLTVDFALEQGRDIYVVPRKYKFN